MVPGPSAIHSNEISPLESPHTNDASRNSSGQSSYDVSPITESPKASSNCFLQAYSQGSNIPAPLRLHKHDELGTPPLDWRDRGSSPPNRDSASTVLTHWHHFSGGPTSVQTGKAAQKSAGGAHIESGGIAREGKVPLLLNPAIGIGSRKDPTNLPTREFNPSFIPKEARQGAIEQHATAKPPYNKPLPPGRSPTYPRGALTASESSRDQIPGMITYRTPIRAPSPFTGDTSLGSNHGGNTSPLQSVAVPVAQIAVNSPGTPGMKSPQLNTTPSHNHGRHSSSSADESNATWTSVQDGSSSLSRTFTSSIPLAQMQFTPSIPGIDDSSSSPKRTVTCKTHDQNPHLITPDFKPMKTQSSLDLEAIENNFRAKMHHMHLEAQPPSRFSATTCASTVPDSPSVTPEMSSHSSITTPPSTILNRKRPVAAISISNPKVASHKPTPQELRKSSCVDAGNVLLSKSLPKSPPEAQAVTRVAGLEAKLENLRRRRSNLCVVIQERTNVVQPGSMPYDMASRHEIKKVTDALHLELAEVTKEEHETGLQLHRAWKRQDTDSAYENSSLWVKRLAS